MKQMKKRIYSIVLIISLLLSVAVTSGCATPSALTPSDIQPSAQPADTAGQTTETETEAEPEPEETTEESYEDIVIIGENDPVVDMTDSVTPETAEELPISEDFLNAYYNFTVSLMKQTSEKTKNTLVSPLSVMLALGMTANGADGDTKTEMESALGGTLVDELNGYLHTYLKSLEAMKETQMNAANSIWIRDTDSLTVHESFLEKCAGYYQAQAYKGNLSDSVVIDSMNRWVKKNTHNMIDKIADSFDSDVMLVLMNALAFEGKWQSQYMLSDVSVLPFTNSDGTQCDAELMSCDLYQYLSDDGAEGFIKNYRDGYAFAAILPDGDIETYLETLTGEKLMKMISNPAAEGVSTKLPKFSYDYSTSLVEPLESMGMKKAFTDRADFSKMSSNNLCISDVIHKTFIEVSESGTKAAAVTAVVMVECAAIIEQMPHEVTLDRPFIYAIIDLENNLPVFIGTVQNLS